MIYLQLVVIVWSRTFSFSAMWSSSVVPFKGQKYSVLKKQAVSSGRPFEDPEFPQNEQSLFLESGNSRSAGIEWKRPGVCHCHCVQLFLLFIKYICTEKMLTFPLCDAMHKCSLSSVHPSVCPSVTFMYSVETSNHIFQNFAPSGSHAILVFRTKRYGNIPMGTPIMGAPNAGDIWKNC